MGNFKYWLCVGLLGCTSKEAASGTPAPSPLPTLTAAPLTDDVTIAPKHARVSPPDPRNPAVPANLTALLGEGFGEVVEKMGETHVARTLDGSAPPAPGPKPKLLVRFAHLPDFQLADDESPARVASVDGGDPTDGAYRPHEAHQCRIINAVVRTLNVVHRTQPLGFVILGGDNADNAQRNEVAWVMALLDGSPNVKCDSGAPDDPVPGPDNDPKDAFIAEGLRMPWYWVTGNHDVEKQGTFPADAAANAEAVGAYAAAGTRDWTAPGGPLTKGDIVADPGRAMLSSSALCAMVAADGDGHGLGQAQVMAGKATYTFDVPSTPLRFLVVDTNAETGGSNGLLHEAHVDAVIKPALAKAAAEKKWLIVASHHRIGSIGDGGDFGGKVQPDAFTSKDYIPLLGSYPNVLFSLVGHSHVHDVHVIGPETGHAFWEVITGSIADQKHQARIIEVWDEDNGWLMLRATSVDYRVDGDSVAEEGRRISVVDYTSGWGKEGSGTAMDRNVELWTKLPPP